MTRILCLEDDPDIGMIVELALGLDPNFDVTLVGSAEAALALLRSRRLRPDLLMLDVRMPGMDGPEALAEIRATDDYAALPAIFLTANAQSAEMTAYRRMAGVIGVVTKPFDPTALAAQIRTIMAEAEADAPASS
jgi:DNA-binding response OmpR family regulator